MSSISGHHRSRHLSLMCVFLMMKCGVGGRGGVSNLNVHSWEQNPIFVFSSQFVHRMCSLKFMYSLFSNKQFIETINRAVCFVCRGSRNTCENLQLYPKLNVILCVAGMKHHHAEGVCTEGRAVSQSSVCPGGGGMKSGGGWYGWSSTLVGALSVKTQTCWF